MRFSGALLFCSLAACSSSSAGPATTPPESFAPEAPPTGSTPTDGAHHGPPANGPTYTALPDCLGTPVPFALTTGPHLDIGFGNGKAPFLIDFGTTGSSIDPSTFATPPTASSCDGSFCKYDGIDFFGGWGTVTLQTSTANVIGTDFLSIGIWTLDYAKKEMRNATKGACSDGALAAAGLAPLSTAGYYTNVVSTLKPQSDLENGAPSNVTVANVPLVHSHLAYVDALFMLDTGFDDSVTPHAINVNQALYDAIVAKDPKALVRDPGRDLTLSTCAGVSEPAEAYALAAGNYLELGSPTGTIENFVNAEVYVKKTPDAAKSCGGIGTWTTPAAQLGTSFFSDLGVLVFDPYATQVWIKRAS